MIVNVCVRLFCVVNFPVILSAIGSVLLLIWRFFAEKSVVRVFHFGVFWTRLCLITGTANQKK